MKLDYEQSIDFLYNSMPVFHSQGASAYKPGLERVMRLDTLFGSPSKGLMCIHIAGTNGKGSTAHTLAAILQSAGYKVGLFTSPHILDFRERIRVNGAMIGRDAVVDFVNRYRALNDGIEPSFFELTTVMAFDYFAKCDVDYAVIETGLGGRLDSTNILTPVLSVITNISLEHTDLLGDTVAKIAKEKAGIIKAGVPVVIGESSSESDPVFESVARELSAPIVFADRNPEVLSAEFTDGAIHYCTRTHGQFDGCLTGEYQIVNANTVLVAVDKLKSIGVDIDDDSVSNGFMNVCSLTGLQGRWMKVGDSPTVVCDTGHNPGCWNYVSSQLAAEKRHKYLLIGFVGDKDVDSILKMIAGIDNVDVVLTQPSVNRAMPVERLAEIACRAGLRHVTAQSVEDGYKKILTMAGKDDFVFVGGSTFIVSDFLSLML